MSLGQSHHQELGETRAGLGTPAWRLTGEAGGFGLHFPRGGSDREQGDALVIRSRTTALLANLRDQQNLAPASSAEYNMDGTYMI